MAKISILILRVVMGGIFLNMGLLAFWTPNWSLVSIQPLISNSRLFSNVYISAVGPGVLPYTTEAVKIILVIVGIFLILGVFVRVAALLATVLMLFFYFPGLNFPYVNSYLAYAAASFCLFALRAGDVFGLGTMFQFSRY